MPSLNSEKLIRENLVNEILQNKTIIDDENDFHFHLKTNSIGKVQSISLDTIDFLKKYFKSDFKVGDNLFDIIPIEFLKDFLFCFKKALNGFPSNLSVKSISNQQIKFYFNPRENVSIDEMNITISESEYDNDKINTVNLAENVKILHETSQVFESLFNNHPDAVYSFDLLGNFISANDVACKLAEVSNSELLKHSFLPLIPDKDRERVLKYFQKAAIGKLQNYETSFEGFKGTKKTLNITNFPIITNGEITGVFGIAKDITEAELTKNLASKLEKRYKTILDQSLDIICTIDNRGYFVHINQACFEIWGYKPEELYGRSYLDFVLKEDWSSTQIAAKEIQSGVNTTNFSNRYLNKDGTIVPMVWSVRWVEEEQLNYCIAKNASEMIAAKNKLEEERNILRAIIDNIPDYIFVKNKNDEVILANRKFYSDYLGKESEAELLNLRPTEYLPEDYGKEVMDDNFLVMEKGQTVINRRDFVKDYLGKEEVILITKVPFKTSENKIIGLVGIARNITKNYEFEQEQLLISSLNETLGAAENLHTGLHKSIKSISKFFDFQYSEAWEVGMMNNRLKMTVTHQIEEIDFSNSTLYDSLRNLNFPKEILELGKIKILEDPFPQEKFFDFIAVGIPIIFDNKVIQILTFFGSNKNRSIGVIKEMFQRISIQIASGIQRKITESQLNNLFKNSPALITIIGLDGYMKKVSPSFTKIFGFSEEELLSAPYRDFLHPDEINVSFEKLKKVTQGYTSKSFESRCRTKSGEWKWISWTPSEIISDDGIISLFGLDITDRKNYAKNLKSYNDQIIDILESITDGFFSFTKDSKVTYFNKEAERLLKIPRDKIMDKIFWDFFPESRKSLSYKKYKEAITTGKKVSFLEYLKHIDKWFEINAYPNSNGLSVYFKDITIKKRADEEIRIAKERYDLVTKVTNEAIYDWNFPNNTMEWSSAYFSTYGYKIPELDNGLEHWENQLHPDDKDKVIASLEGALGDPSVDIWEYEYKLIKANNTVSIVMDRGLITRNQDGSPIRMIGSLQDITQLKQNELTLEKLNSKLKTHAEELAVSNAELEQFAYIASHDLQEPLRMVTSFLTQLNKKYKNQLDPKAQQYIYYATDGAIRMRQILLDLLEYSRVGKLDYQLEQIDLNIMLEEIIKLHKDLISEANGTIVYENLPIIFAASSPLQRVLSNLLTNALKYQKPNANAEIKIEVLENEVFWQINFQDNGIGIEDQFFEKIFVVFQRLHNNEQYKGTGIGLAICKKIVESHGGKIWVTSNIYEGSTFHITIKKQN